LVSWSYREQEYETYFLKMPLYTFTDHLVFAVVDWTAQEKQPAVGSYAMIVL